VKLIRKVWNYLDWQTWTLVTWALTVLVFSILALTGVIDF
jgi:hypothetical protein